ncbi:POK9 protein, partial [Onychorhynchus coronatus]|nr:POK9 protein [Onychorhynchus coronatus]
QLRQTISQYGPKSEPVKQMLDYMFDTMLLVPNDLRGIIKLIFTQHQHCNIGTTSLPLQPATSGSLGLDLAAAVDTTLMTTHPCKIPTGIFRPIQINGQDYSALLLGRSSVTLMELFILPGIIDADYIGEIQIMAYTPFPPIQIKKGERIAQLLPLPQFAKGLAAQRNVCGDQGFSSSGVAMLTLDLFTRPKKKVKITHAGSSIEVWRLLDTGADSSIINPCCWPKKWRSSPVSGTISRVGDFTTACKT